MITLITGENSYEIAQALGRIETDFDGASEKFDGSELEARQLPDLLMGGTLFADKRLVVIKNLSENKSVWNDFVDWIPRVSSDVHLVLVEPKPDKRTKTFKDLKQVGEVREFAPWGERDMGKAEQWLAGEAKTRGVELDKKCVQLIVERVGLDQWGLAHALDKLGALDKITPEIIIETIDASPNENVFGLFDAALRGDSKKVTDMIRTLEQTDDPYMTFGLLSSQAFQLAALAVADSPNDRVAKDIGAHPFVLQKLAPHAKRLGRTGARKVIACFAEADTAMKTSSGNLWLLIERALIKVANI